MRKTLFLLCALISFAAYAVEPSTAADSVQTDTVKSLYDIKDVTVTRKGNTLKLQAERSDGKGTFNYRYSVTPADSVDDSWNTDLPFLRKRSSHFYPYCGNIICGLTFPQKAPAGMHFGMEIGTTDLIGVHWTPNNNSIFGLAVGVLYQRLDSDKGYYYYQRDSRLEILECDPNMKKVESYFDWWSITLPLRFTQRLGKSFSISLAAIADFNFYTKAHTSYKIDDMKYEYDCGGLQQKVFGMQYSFTLGLSKSFGIYAKYAPNKMFDAGYGPQFKTLSFGITFLPQ